jgi:hypothetical protein
MVRILRVLGDGNAGDDPVSTMYEELEQVCERHIARHKPICTMCQAPVVKRKFDQ